MSALLAEFAEAVIYSPISGEFRWARDVSSRVKCGAPAGTICKGGYRVIGLRRRYVKAHRLAFFMFHGREPNGLVDHINGNKLDNWAGNLRECNHAENGQNSKKPKNNSSGYVGVYWHKRRQKWVASIRHNYQGIHLGYFSEREDAYAAYLTEKARLHTAAPHGCGLETSRAFDPSTRLRKRTEMLTPKTEQVPA